MLVAMAEQGRPGSGWWLGRLLAVIGPGVLVAATGVGAGDLSTAGLAGARFGVALAWAVVLGAVLKWAVTEGLARYQLATGETMLAGAFDRLGAWAAWVFLVYLAAWTLFVGAALMSACGSAAGAMAPLTGEAGTDKLIWGASHSAAAAGLVVLGGYRLFERVMAVCVGAMFVCVVGTAALVLEDPAGLLRGLVVPSVPSGSAGGDGLSWAVALVGGVGGTVTVLCYGYWIREEGRSGAGELARCRVDLALGYAATAVFGVSMLVIASGTAATGSGVGFVVGLGDRLGSAAGSWARWVFLAGAWAAVFSSMLGVWQATPYLFAEAWGLRRGKGGGADARCVVWRGQPRAYWSWLAVVSTVPAVGMMVEFATVQRVYAVFGAMFVPLLAAGLLVLLGGRGGVGELRNRWWSVVLLAGAVVGAGGLVVRAVVRVVGG